MPRTALCAMFLLLGLLHAAPASAIPILADTFADGTTQGWSVGLLGTPSPVPPVNVATGGPAGVGDSFLQLRSVGGSGPGSRLVAVNVAQWTGNYLAAGITGISMDLLNLGPVDLAVRLYLENPMGAPPTASAVSAAALLAAGGSWTSVFFPLAASQLTVLSGDVTTLLSNVTALRIMNNPSASFPPPAVVASLGIDNIRAVGPVSVPEPASALVLLVGLSGWGIGRLLKTRPSARVSAACRRRDR